jgi:uncharacterized YccA/Bax inhibitor family protein
MDMKSGNPALANTTFGNLATTDRPMTLAGTVNRTAMLLALLVGGAGWVWNLYYASGDLSVVGPYVAGGTIVGAILALVTMFAKRAAPFTAPLYAVCEGLAIGGISAYYERSHPGIAIQAAGLTMATLATMLAGYRFGIIRVTERFRMGVFAATGGVALLYLIDLVLGFFGHSVPMIHEGGLVGVGFSLVVVGIAALNLVMDFDFISRGVAARAPKYMEWYLAFALVVTLVWLYLEMLRLLSKRR